MCWRWLHLTVSSSRRPSGPPSMRLYPCGRNMNIKHPMKPGSCSAVMYGMLFQGIHLIDRSYFQVEGHIVDNDNRLGIGHDRNMDPANPGIGLLIPMSSDLMRRQNHREIVQRRHGTREI